jgi:hypothetical protein
MLDADPKRVHERGGDGQTPLHFARSREVVDLLLERGADPDARDVDHRATPAKWMLHQALIERRDSVHDSAPLGWCFHGARFCRSPEGDYPAVARLLLEGGRGWGRIWAMRRRR